MILHLMLCLIFRGFLITVWHSTNPLTMLFFQPLFSFKDWDPDIAPCAQPNLDFLAPEFALTESCSLASDMFSIGVLIYAVFNNGKSLYDCKHQLSAFKKNAEEVI